MPDVAAKPYKKMYCRKCKAKMVEKKRVYHKKRKWVCPRCGASRFQEIKKDAKTG